MSVDARRTNPGQLPPDVAATLATAEIPPSKLGPARRARLADAECELYVWIMRRFATDGRPNSAEVRAAAERLGIDPQDALETLAREDLVHRGSDGEISVAYPFSGRPAAHRVRFPDGHEVDAMCAIDALGIAPMFRVPIEVESRDPVSGDAIRVQVAPDGPTEWWPESAVVVAGAIRDQGDTCCGCCPVLNFFVSPARTPSAGSPSTRRYAATSSRCARRPPLGGPSSATCSQAPDANTDRPRPLQRLLAEPQPQLVEVLPAAEYEDEHLPGAINMPLKELDRETTRGLDRGRPVIAYCYDYQ